MKTQTAQEYMASNPKVSAVKVAKKFKIGVSTAYALKKKVLTDLWQPPELLPMPGVKTKKSSWKKIEEEVNQTLDARAATYGQFIHVSHVSQAIKEILRNSNNWDNLSDDHREALETIATKMGRIMNGDPNYHDSWHDIAGYAQLVADRIQGYMR